jgi:hypothetical protein
MALDGFILHHHGLVARLQPCGGGDGKQSRHLVATRLTALAPQIFWHGPSPPKHYTLSRLLVALYRRLRTMGAVVTRLKQPLTARLVEPPGPSIWGGASTARLRPAILPYPWKRCNG